MQNRLMLVFAVRRCTEADGIVFRGWFHGLFLLILLSGHVYGTSLEATFTLSGHVTDTSGAPLHGALVMVYPGDYIRVTNAAGHFHMNGIRAGKYMVKVTYTGFAAWVDTIHVIQDQHLQVVLRPGFSTLSEVVVTANHHDLLRREQSLSVEAVDRDFIRNHAGTTLMHALRRIPGVQSSDIGSGQSRPIIRGLGLNRVVVVEHGIRHEGQQWGTDHGLELDRFAAGSVEVIRGPASVLYGSDALAGVMVIQDLRIPMENTWGVVTDITAASNNLLAGGSLQFYGRAKRLYTTFRVTGLGYGDLRVPSDVIPIYGYLAPLKEGRLRNTAGRERNLHLSMGYEGSKIRTRLYVSQITGRAGFLANAHGLEPRSVDTALHDKNNRDVLMPGHAVVHRKVILRSSASHKQWFMTLDLGYQHNHRSEFSEYNQHGYMPPTLPEIQGMPDTLDRSFSRGYWSGVGRATRSFGTRGAVTFGVQADHDENKISGRSFLIPAYAASGLAMFAYHRYQPFPGHILHAGIRLDAKRLLTEPYLDWYATPVVSASDTLMQHLTRASALNRHFVNTTWSVGYNRNLTRMAFKVNLAQGFRNPMPHELAANGINYHQFSFEVGDSTLTPEISYQADAGVSFASGNVAFEITPFASYAPNYIYLNPTSAFDHLYGAGHQIHRYTQSEVLRSGAELHMHYDLTRNIRLGAIAEYSRSVQLSGAKKGFTLPFAPPFSSLINLKISGKSSTRVSSPWISADVMMVAAQHRIVPPEEPTPGYLLWNLTAGARIHVARQHAELVLAVHNILNTKYMEHVSYYRMLNVPGPGRNVSLQLSIPLSGVKREKLKVKS